MDLNKHIVTNDTGKPFHSNGYARVMNGDRIGAAGNVSFEQRQQIERNRRLIDGYHRSSIGNAYGVLRAKSVVKDTTNLVDSTNTSQRPSLQQHNSLDSKPQGYNPYA
ncbi:MAG TPA: hypothetical protein VFD55_00845 [Candidatus Angelobacter sp.]|nr:hypothetical protein [Candidatus Angelobacter sp.]